MTASDTSQHRDDRQLQRLLVACLEQRECGELLDGDELIRQHP